MVDVKTAFSIVKNNAKGYMQGVKAAVDAAKNTAKTYRQMYGVKSTWQKIRSHKTFPVPQPGTVSAYAMEKDSVITAARVVNEVSEGPDGPLTV